MTSIAGATNTANAGNAIDHLKNLMRSNAAWTYMLEATTL